MICQWCGTSGGRQDRRGNCAACGGPFAEQPRKWEGTNDDILCRHYDGYGIRMYDTWPKRYHPKAREILQAMESTGDHVAGNAELEALMERWAREEQERAIIATNAIAEGMYRMGVLA